MRPPLTPEPQTPVAGPPTAEQSAGFLRALGVAAIAVGACWLYGRFRGDPEVREMRRMAELFEAKGAAVRLDAAGSLRPPKLGGHIPGVFAVFRDGTEVALEYENDRSALRAHARKQDRAFRAWERRSEYRLYAQVVVPNGRGGRS